jgi:antitoxin HicB
MKSMKCGIVILYDDLRIIQIIDFSYRGAYMTEAMIKIKIEKLDEGGYLATSDTLQGLIAQGRTIAETIEIAQDVAKKLIESYMEHGDPLPFEIKAQKDFTITTAVPVSINA